MQIITKCPHCDNDIEISITKRTEAVLPTPSPILEDVKCPDCGGPMRSRTGQYGTFWGCMKYPDCRGTRDSMGRSKADREAERSGTLYPDNSGHDRDTIPSEHMSFNKKRWS